MNKGFSTIIAILVIGIMSIGAMGNYFYEKISGDRFGATIPITVAWFETTLTSKITSSATSMTLTSGTDAAGTALSGYMCFTINEGSASQEFVCGTASSTAVTSMIRGIDPVDGDLEVTALKKAHRRGASVKVTNYPQLAIVSRIMSGDETIPNAIKYASEPTWSYGTHQLVTWDKTKEYTDDVATSGAANADLITKGLVELATTSELIAGSATGSTGAYLVIPGSFFNQTSSATTLVPVTDSSGKLYQGFLDLTEDWIISGGVTISGDATTSGSVNMATTTFSVIPTMPTSTPSLDEQVACKKYVDDYADSTYTTSTTSTVRNSNDAEKNTTSTSYVKLKEVELGADLDGCTMIFALKSSVDTNAAYGRIYKNGAAIGTERQTVSTTTVEYAENFTSFVSGDLIQIYAKQNSSSHLSYISNMRFYYQEQLEGFGGVPLATPLDWASTTVITVTNQDP